MKEERWMGYMSQACLIIFQTSFESHRVNGTSCGPQGQHNACRPQNQRFMMTYTLEPCSGCLGRIISFCFTGDTRRVTRVIYPVISHERGKMDGIHLIVVITIYWDYTLLLNVFFMLKTSLKCQCRYTQILFIFLFFMYAMGMYICTFSNQEGKICL
jgi:hypothetical protein